MIKCNFEKDYKQFYLKKQIYLIIFKNTFFSDMVLETDTAMKLFKVYGSEPKIIILLM